MAKQWHQLEKLDHRSLKKLQQDRDKAAALLRGEAERKRKLVVAFAVMFAFAVLIVFVVILKQRGAEQAFQEARKKLYISMVSQATGRTFGRALGDWDKVSKGFSFDSEYTLKTEKDGFLVVELQLKNLLKLNANSEMVVFKPELNKKVNLVIKERAKLKRGEVTVAIALDGRDLLEVEAGGMVALGASGLYKILYNRDKDEGEVVVKNGLVEVYSKRNPKARVKVSGFYKVTFTRGTLDRPTQASVIQYDWR